MVALGPKGDIYHDRMADATAPKHETGSHTGVFEGGNWHLKVAKTIDPRFHRRQNKVRSRVAQGRLRPRRRRHRLSTTEGDNDSRTT